MAAWEAGLGEREMMALCGLFELGVRGEVLRVEHVWGTRSAPVRSLSFLRQPGRRCRQKPASAWRARSWARPATRCGPRCGISSRHATGASWSAPRASPSTAWPWCFVVLWAWPASGRWRRVAPAPRLPNLVRPGHGRLQRLGARIILEAQTNRGVVQIALNLLEGAAVLTRAQQCARAGRRGTAAAFAFAPRLLG